MIMWLRERNLLVDDIWQIPIDPVTSLDRRESMKKLVFCLKIGGTVFLYISMSISARGNRFSFQTVIFPGDTFTQLLGINDFELIAGYHGATVNKGFVFTFPNNFTSENFPGSAQTQVIGINNQGHTDGFYIETAGTTHGFLDINGTFTTVDFPGTTFNQLLGLNNFDQAAGYYAVPPTPAGIDTPYIFDNNGGVFLRIRIAQATGGAQATGINDNQSISGFFIDGAGKNHGFLLPKPTFTILDFPPTTSTQAFGLNNEDDVVG